MFLSDFILKTVANDFQLNYDMTQLAQDILEKEESAGRGVFLSMLEGQEAQVGQKLIDAAQSSEFDKNIEKQKLIDGFVKEIKAKTEINDQIDWNSHFKKISNNELKEFDAFEKDYDIAIQYFAYNEAFNVLSKNYYLKQTQNFVKNHNKNEKTEDVFVHLNEEDADQKQQYFLKTLMQNKLDGIDMSGDKIAEKYFNDVLLKKKDVEASKLEHIKQVYDFIQKNYNSEDSSDDSSEEASKES